MNLTKQDIKDLPNSPIGNETKECVTQYVMLVYERVPKPDALKEAFPDRYQRAVDRAGGNQDVLNANIRKEINQVERSKYCRDIYASEHKDWWIKFLTKKEKVFENLVNIALDEGESARTRVEASRAFLQFAPEKAIENNVKVEVNVTGDDFKKTLLERKKALYDTATMDVIDVEVEPEESK